MPGPQVKGEVQERKRLRLGPKLDHKFKASLGHLVGPCLYRKRIWRKRKLGNKRSLVGWEPLV